MEYGRQRICGAGMKNDALICRLTIVTAVLLAMIAITLIDAAVGYASEPLSLEQAVNMALGANPALKSADARIAETDAGVQRSRSSFLPRVMLSEIWSRTDSPMMALGTKLNQEGVGPADFNPDVMNNPAAISNFNTRLSVMQPVWNGGKEYIGRSQARTARDAAVQDRERTRQETVFNVAKAYNSLLLAREYHKVAQQSLATCEANVKLAQSRAAAGAALESDVLRSKVQLAEVNEMLTRAMNGVRLASAALNFAIGIAQDREFEPSDALSQPPVDGELFASINAASSKRPDMQSLQLNRMNARMSVEMARADYLPTVNLMGQADWNSKSLLGSDGRSWMLAAALQWNLFDGLVTRSRVSEAAATSSRMDAISEQMRSGIELQVRQAYYNLTASRDRIAATATSVSEAEEGLRIVQKRYETGMTTFVDVLGAENALIRARTNAIQAGYDSTIALAELKLATGEI